MLIYIHEKCRCIDISLCRSFEEMEAQITAGMKTPVLNSRPGPEGSAVDKGRKRESQELSRTHSADRDAVVSFTSTHTNLTSLGELKHTVHTVCDPLSYVSRHIWM